MSDDAESVAYLRRLTDQNATNLRVLTRHHDAENVLSAPEGTRALAERFFGRTGDYERPDRTETERIVDRMVENATNLARLSIALGVSETRSRVTRRSGITARLLTRSTSRRRRRRGPRRQ